jgi:hypothetical protein
MHRFVLEQMADFARVGDAIEGPSHFRSWSDPDATVVVQRGCFRELTGRPGALT